MSAVVKLAAKLPGDYETNGVDALAAQLCNDPAALRVAVVWFDVARQVIDTDSGDHVPIIRLRRIEPLGRVESAPAELQALVAEAVSERTGRAPIPFGLVEVEEGHDPDQLTLTDADAEEAG